jgi:hypothetical protein
LTSEVEEVVIEEGHVDLILIKSTPLKVSVFALHFVADRLPTRDNLLRRGIVNVDSQFCSLDCGFVESLSHLFFVCEGSHRVWCGVKNWVGIQGAFPNNALSHAS